MEIQKPEAVLARAPVGTSLRVSFNMLVHLNFQIGQAIDHFRGAIIKKWKILGKNSQIGFTPPPHRKFQTFLNFRHF